MPSLRSFGAAAALLLPLAAEAALRAVDRRDWLPVGLAYLAACLIFAWLAPRASPVDGEPHRDGPRPALLLLALVILALELFLAWRDNRQWLLVPLWLLGIAAWTAAWVRAVRLPRLTRREVALLLGVVGLAAALRFYDLADFQPIQHDEVFIAAHVSLSLDPFESGWSAGTPLFAQTSERTPGQVVLGAYRRWAAFAVGGINNLMLRLPSAVHGTLEIGLIFFVGRSLFGTRVGLVAALVLATLTAHLSFSRHGLDNLESSAVWGLAALFLARAFSHRSVAMLAAAGWSMSLGLYVYWAARPVVVFVPVALALAALDPRLRGRWLAWGGLAMIGGFLIGVGPLLVAYYRDPSIFSTSSDLTSWLGTALAAFRRTGEISALLPLWEHFYRALMAYNLVPSANQHYWPERGLFTALPAGLLYGAVALVSLRLGDWRHRLLALWFWGPTIGLSAMADQPPPVHRMLPALAVSAILIALAFDRVVAGWQQVGGVVRRAALPLAATALSVALIHEAAFYFLDFGRRDLDPHENGFVQYLNRTPPGRHMVLVSPYFPKILTLYSTNNGRRNSYDGFARAVDQIPDLSPRPNGLFYMVHSDRRVLLQIFRDAYPGGRELPQISPDPNITDRGRYYSFSDRLTWTAFEVDAVELERMRGLRLTATDRSGRRVERPVPGVVTPDDLADGLDFPVDLEWRGWYRGPPERHVDTTLVASGGAVRLRLADQAIGLEPDAERPITLPPGAQPLVASARLEHPSSRVAVRWSGLAPHRWGDFPVGMAAAWAGPPRVALDWVTLDRSEVVRREYDVMIADLAVGTHRPRQPDLLARWSADLRVERAGPYDFFVEGDGPTDLWISGRSVPPSGGAEPGRRAVWLSSGVHPVVVERDPRAGGQTVLIWRFRNEPRSVVPMSAFEPLRWP